MAEKKAKELAEKEAKKKEEDSKSKESKFAPTDVNKDGKTDFKDVVAVAKGVFGKK